MLRVLSGSDTLLGLAFQSQGGQWLQEHTHHSCAALHNPMQGPQRALRSNSIQNAPGSASKLRVIIPQQSRADGECGHAMEAIDMMLQRLH